MRRPPRSWLVALVATIGALGLAEIALRAFAPVPDPYAGLKVRPAAAGYVPSAFPPNLTLETDIEPGLPGMTGPSRFTTNNLGFRGDSLASPKPGDEYRVFLLGGSSTECFYLDDTASLDAVVQRELQRQVGVTRRVRVYGAGKSGDRSDDHVAMFTQRVAHVEPDLIVVFAGINDLLAALAGHDPLHRPSAAAADTLGLGALLRVTATELQLARRLYYLLKRLQPPTGAEALARVPLRSDYRTLVDLRRAAPVTAEDPPVPSAAYASNLRTLVGAARANGVAVVLMTQQTTWASTVDPDVETWQWMLYREGKTYDAARMDRALEALNDVTRGVAADEGAALYDPARSLPKSLEFFYDDVHFNARGARRAGEELASVIARTMTAGRPR